MTNISHFLTLCCSVLVVSLGTAATADDFDDFIYEPRHGLYFGGSFGYQLEFDIISNDIIGSSDELEFSLDDDFTYSGVIGIYLDQWRLEFEANYFQTDYTDVKFLAFDINADGDIEYISGLGNVYYDIPLGSKDFNLYLGAGAGFSVVQSDADLDATLINSSTVGGITTTAAIDAIDDTFTTFTYQVMAGLSYRVADNVTLTGGYRLRGFTESGNGDIAAGLIFREHHINTFEVGVRFDF